MCKLVLFICFVKGAFALLGCGGNVFVRLFVRRDHQSGGISDSVRQERRGRGEGGFFFTEEESKVVSFPTLIVVIFGCFSFNHYFVAGLERGLR